MVDMTLMTGDERICSLLILLRCERAEDREKKQQ